MKKVVALLSALLLVVTLTACGSGNVKNVHVIDWEPSEVYTDKDIEDSIKIIKNYFADEFSDCTLTKITYAGDEESQEHIEWAERNNADEVIVLISSFDVGSSGGDGSLNPNSTYDNWMWILVRSNGGKWKHVDHGY